jgi:hypothetical protein
MPGLPINLGGDFTARQAMLFSPSDQSKIGWIDTAIPGTREQTALFASKLTSIAVDKCATLLN